MDDVRVTLFRANVQPLGTDGQMQTRYSATGWKVYTKTKQKKKTYILYFQLAQLPLPFPLKLQALHHLRDFGVEIP